MVNASALDLAKAALASGASPEQVALMMHQSGASQAEMSKVQRAVQEHMAKNGEPDRRITAVYCKKILGRIYYIERNDMLICIFIHTLNTS